LSTYRWLQIAFFGNCKFYFNEFWLANTLKSNFESWIIVLWFSSVIQIQIRFFQSNPKWNLHVIALDFFWEAWHFGVVNYAAHWLAYPEVAKKVSKFTLVRQTFLDVLFSFFLLTSGYANWLTAKLTTPKCLESQKEQIL